MIRRKRIFECTECGEKFRADDIELNATVLSVPQPCPHCQSIRTMPWGFMSFLSKSTYEDIWKQMEERK